MAIRHADCIDSTRERLENTHSHKLTVAQVLEDAVARPFAPADAVDGEAQASDLARPAGLLTNITSALKPQPRKVCAPAPLPPPPLCPPPLLSSAQTGGKAAQHLLWNY